MKSKADLGNVISASINEVLSRTLITSLTVALVIGALILLGGKVLFEFSLALFIGRVYRDLFFNIRGKPPYIFMEEEGPLARS